MLGLHNILLISQPSASSQHTPPPSEHPHLHHFTTNHHHHHHHNNTNSTFWGLHPSTTATKHALPDDDSNNNEDSDGSLRVCRDCGNRAKKECTFNRCRTCCKTRAFDCPTHVRSTWIPASRRREKKLLPAASSSSSSHGLKRPRPPPSTTTTSSSAAANDLSLGISSHPQDSRFKKSLPGRIEAPAVFRNIKMMDLSSDNGEADNAYVATVNISGHVFKGLLYDHGSDKSNAFQCVTKLHTDHHHQTSKMQMETTISTTSFRYRDSSSPIVDPSTTYTATSAN